ncbi:hypothetical protein ON010_g5316 [Phytophthora cinnamomi]|nr:hypothetical protein ON010_g5316 [Phytophthora cinnamomi]
MKEETDAHNLKGFTTTKIFCPISSREGTLGPSDLAFSHYVDTRDQYDYCERPGYDCMVTDVSTALSSCLFLDALQVQLHQPLNSDVDSNIEQNASYDNFPDRKAVYANMFGNFCEAVFTYCPFVSYFKIT